MSEYHNPVMLRECLEALITNKSGIYADATFGGGGHSRGGHRGVRVHGVSAASEAGEDGSRLRCFASCWAFR